MPKVNELEPAQRGNTPNLPNIMYAQCISKVAPEEAERIFPRISSRPLERDAPCCTCYDRSVRHGTNDANFKRGKSRNMDGKPINSTGSSSQSEIWMCW